MQSENPVKEILHESREDGDHQRPDKMHQWNECTEEQSGFESIKHENYFKK